MVKILQLIFSEVFLPLGGKFIESTEQFLKLLWDRNSQPRIEPRIAASICGILFGCPCSSFSGDGKVEI